MLFCISAEYTPAALTALRENPSNRAEAMANLCQAAGGKLIAMYGIIGNGPGGLAIIDVEPQTAAAITSLITSGGAVHNVQVRRLYTMDEITGIRQKAKELSAHYKLPGQ
jgi:uncharacterized protein with GYD domain